MASRRTRTLVLADETRAAAIARSITGGDPHAEAFGARAAEAEWAVDRVRPDVVLTATADGPLFRALRERHPELPVVALVDANDPAEAEHALAAGATDVLLERDLEPGFVAWHLGLAVERHAAARRLRDEKRIAESANARKSDFLSSMSHKMRTPLNTVLGMAELLAETSLDERQRGYVHTLQRASDHVLALIDSVLDLARIESGTVTLDDVGFDLYDVAESAIDLVRVEARRKRLELGWNAGPGVPRGVRGDPRRVRQVLVNLLANSVKFTDSGRVWLSVELDGPALHFSIVDTGIGVPADKVDAIFTSFVQGDGSIERRFGGFGLGLHIVKRIVEQMSGRIWVESAPAKGSTFHVTLALPAERGVVATSFAHAKRGGTLKLDRKLRVLVVDDSEDNRMLLGEYLRGAGVDVEFADDGETAIERATTKPFEAVFMDLQMPTLDGYATTRELLRLARARGMVEPPVIALSAHVLAESFARSAEAGCAMQLTKPIRKRTLLDALARVTGARVVDETKAPREEILPLLPKFFANRRNDVRVIRECIEKHEHRTIATLAHNMRGTGASYGFPEISALGDDLQEAGKRGDDAAILRLTGELESLLDRLEAQYAPRAKRLTLS